MRRSPTRRRDILLGVTKPITLSQMHNHRRRVGFQTTFTLRKIEWRMKFQLSSICIGRLHFSGRWSASTHPRCPIHQSTLLSCICLSWGRDLLFKMASVIHSLNSSDRQNEITSNSSCSSFPSASAPKGESIYQSTVRLPSVGVGQLVLYLLYQREFPIY